MLELRCGGVCAYSNKAELAALFEARRAGELAFLERCAACTGEYWASLESLRAADAEQYARLKGQLETDIQNLEQHLQHMRATYQVSRHARPPPVSPRSRGLPRD